MWGLLNGMCQVWMAVYWPRVGVVLGRNHRESGAIFGCWPSTDLIPSISKLVPRQLYLWNPTDIAILAVHFELWCSTSNGSLKHEYLIKRLRNLVSQPTSGNAVAGIKDRNLRNPKKWERLSSGFAGVHQHDFHYSNLYYCGIRSLIVCSDSLPLSTRYDIVKRSKFVLIL